MLQAIVRACRQDQPGVVTEASEAVCRASRAHAVYPIVRRTFAAPEPPLVAEMDASLAMQGVLGASLVARVQERLAGAGMDCLAFKGPVLSVLLYDDASRRQSGDVDVLIREADAVRAVRLLREDDFEDWIPLPRALRDDPRAWLTQLTFREPASAQYLDLHWRLTPRFYPPLPPFEQLFARRQMVRVQGREVATFGNEDTLLHLAVHGANHAFMRLGWLCDVDAAVRRLRIDWDLLFRLADGHGAARAVLVALRSAHLLLYTPLPEEAARRIERDRAVDSLATQVVAHLQHGKKRSALDPTAFFVRCLESPRARFRFLLGKLLAPSVAELSSVPLPARLAALHYVLRPFLAAAFLVRRATPAERLRRLSRG